jgi:hypothetical protein
MRDLINIIREAFDSQQVWRWEDIDHEYALAKFEIKNKPYAFVARAHNKVWDIQFGNMVGGTKFSLKPTNEATPFAVFATVITIVKDLHDKFSPKEIYFTTPRHDNTARASVYEKLAKKLAAQYNGQVTFGDFEDDDTTQFRVKFA